MSQDSLVGDESRPLFFLSYARSRFRPDDGSDPDRFPAKFFADLSDNVAQLTGAALPGFMDRDIAVGTQWSDRLSEALGTCRVFVALLSPSYFTSEWCGREWAAFAQRQSEGGRAAAERPTAIIPVLWTPVDMEEIPEHVRAIQHLRPELPAAYGNLGIYGIMKLNKYRDQYKNTVYNLAHAITDAAKADNLPADPLIDLITLNKSFDQLEPATDEGSADLARKLRALAASELESADPDPEPTEPRWDRVRTNFLEDLARLRTDPRTRVRMEQRSHELSVLLGAHSAGETD